MEDFLGIEFGSINTGLPKDIVQQIMKAERAPIDKMNERKAKIENKEKLVSDLIKLVEGMRANLDENSNAKSLRELQYKTNDELIGVTLDKNLAGPGSYQMEVVSLAQKSSAMSSGFADKDESYIGVGFIQYSLPNGENREVYVDSDHASLNGVAGLINNDPENGMKATVINDGSGSDTPWKLIITLEETGANQKAEFPYFYFVDGEDDFYLESEREAKNAKVKLDGFEVEYPDNKIKDLIPGVTIDLRKAKPGEEFSLVITEDTQKITEKVNDLITKINEVLKFIKEQNSLDAHSDTSKTLGGDITLQTLESRIRTAVFTDIQTTEGPRRVGDLGLTFQRNGLLQLDEKKFQNMLSQNYKVISQVLRGAYTKENGQTKGFMDHLDDLVRNTLQQPNGLLPSRKGGFRSNISQIDRQIENKERMLTQKERNLKDKFARLEGTISKIRSSGAGLAALGANPANPVAELGGGV